MERIDLKNWNNKKYWVQYDTTVRTVLNRMYSSDVSKELIIPEYQRDYVWKEKNAPKLLLSLFKGFPVGNIVLWENKKNNTSTLSLIDGLQRYMTILKLCEKPFNYVSYSLYEYWLEKKGYKKFPSNSEDELINEKEAFRHLKSSIHHKRSGYKPATFEDVVKKIDKANAKPFTNEIKLRLKEFISDFDYWYKNEFKEINIPHYIIDNMKINEVAEVFELINDTGVKLNKFEIASANWSSYRINVHSEIKFIKDFNEARAKKYLENFLDKDKASGHLAGFDNINVIPSNFLYAIFYEIFKNDSILKNTFIDNDNEFTIVKKAIEPLCEVVMHILCEHYNIKEIEFDDLGKHLHNKIESESDVNGLMSKIKNSFTKVKNNIEYIRTSKLNGENKYPSYPAWLICTFAIHVVKGFEKKYFNDWFLKELLFDKRLDASTGNKAREIIKNSEFEKKLEINLAEELEKLIYKEEFKLIAYSSRNKLVVLSMIQKGNRSGATNEEVDHFLPWSKLVGKVDYIDDIFNLQYLDKVENSNKSDELIIKQWKYDVYSKFYSSNEKKEMEILCEKLIETLNYGDTDENLKTINEIFNEILKLREKIIKRVSDIFKK